MADADRGAEYLDGIRGHQPPSNTSPGQSGSGNRPEGVLTSRGKRPPPAFQCYASDWIAKEEYVLAGFAERGLLFTLYNYCWHNKSIFKDFTKMARLLGMPEQDLRTAWGPPSKSVLGRAS